MFRKVVKVYLKAIAEGQIFKTKIDKISLEAECFISLNSFQNRFIIPNKKNLNAF